MYSKGISNLPKRISLLTVFLLLISASLLAQTEIRQLDRITLIAAQQDMQAGEYLAKKVSAHIDRFQIKMGLFPRFSYRIHIARDDSQYREFTGSAGGIIEFSNAFYSHKDQTAYVRNPADLHDLDHVVTVLFHEYIHAFVFRYWKDAPLWFHEGMAVYYTEGLPYSRFLSFIQLYIFGEVPRLNDMSDHYPKNPVEWEAFYMKSAYAIDFMLKKYPRQYFTLWDYALPHRDFNRAMRAAFMASPENIGAQFDEYLRKKMRMEMLIGFSMLIWMFMPFLVFIAWIRKKFINRRIRRNWELLENTDETIETPER